MTELLYWQQPFIFECEATIVCVDRDHEGLWVAFDQTIFYPQGGGQPSDSGWIQSTGMDIPVLSLRFDRKTQMVEHQIETELAIGTKVIMSIDREKRLLHAGLHSAGHLMHYGLECMEFGLLKCVKSYHFPDSPCIDYQFDAETYPRLCDPDGLESFRQSLEHTIRTLIDRSLRISTYEEVSESARDTDKVRMVAIEGSKHPRPCGGTHLSNTGDIPGFAVRKIVRKRDILKISYSI